MALDADSPFVELCGLVGYAMHDDKDGSDAGGGIIAGIGFVSGVRCLISASNSAIKGGTMSPMGVQKTLRLQKIAFEQKLPMLTLGVMMILLLLIGLLELKMTQMKVVRI